MVHSFDSKDAGFADFARFSAAIGATGVAATRLVGPINREGVDLYLGWTGTDPLTKDIPSWMAASPMQSFSEATRRGPVDQSIDPAERNWHCKYLTRVLRLIGASYVGCIFNLPGPMGRLSRNPRFRRVLGRFSDSIRRHGRSVEIEATDTETGESTTLEMDGD